MYIFLHFWRKLFHYIAWVWIFFCFLAGLPSHFPLKCQEQIHLKFSKCFLNIDDRMSENTDTVVYSWAFTGRCLPSVWHLCSNLKCAPKPCFYSVWSYVRSIQCFVFCIFFKWRKQSVQKWTVTFLSDYTVTSSVFRLGHTNRVLQG